MRKKMLELHGTVKEMKKVLDSIMGSNNQDILSSSTPTVSSYATTMTVLDSMLPVASKSVLTCIPPAASTSPVTLTSPVVSVTTSTPPLTTSPEPASEIEISNSDLIPDADIMQIAMKSCSRMNFAARLSVRLFDEETRLTHNVAGRGKPKLDPNIISYIKGKCFELFPCGIGKNVANQWVSCITAIDERSRRLKNKKKV